MSGYKVLLLGESVVGKTALIEQYTSHQFTGNYDKTLEDSYRKRVVIDGEPLLLEMVDFSCEEEFTALLDQFKREAEGFLLVYSINSRISFDKIASIYESVLRIKDTSEIPVVLVGGKCDLETERQVSVEEAQECATIICCPFFETSAKSRINVEEAFHELVREIRKNRNKNNPTAPAKQHHKSKRCYPM